MALGITNLGNHSMMNNILRSIYLGNIKDAFFAGDAAPALRLYQQLFKFDQRQMKMDTLYVHEDIVPGYTPTFHVPILNVEPEVPLVIGDYFANPNAEETIDTIQRKRLVDPGKLVVAHMLLDDYYENYKPLLIHCLGGVERSPLTLATWMVKNGLQPDLDAAYVFLKNKRSVVQDRRHWLTQPGF
jgi:hypothetical protein